MKHTVLTMMKKKAEVEYQLLLSVLGSKKFPDPDFLEVFSYKCDNEWFRTEEFRMLLIEYRLKKYPKLIHDYREKLRVERYHAKAKARRERVKRKYTRHVADEMPKEIVVSQPKPEHAEIQFNVKIVDNIE